MRLQNKRVVVTAAASGMGRAGCELFAREGARVAAVDRDETKLKEVVDGINTAGGDAQAFVADLSDADVAGTVADDAIMWLGGIDVLWSHAGMPAPGDVEELDLDAYHTAVDVNLTQATVISARAITRMRSQSSGSIIFTASTSGLVGSALSPLYSALKSGVVGLTKGLAVRYAADGVRVNALCPGPIATPMLYNDFMNVDARFTKEENEERVIAGVPLGRAGQPEEIAHAALWLASDESSFVTGIALPIDGGLTAR